MDNKRLPRLWEIIVCLWLLVSLATFLYFRVYLSTMAQGLKSH
jgi:hypothetical protein